MKVAILQFSDIHISSERDYVISRLKYIVKAVKPITNECQRIIIAITGDIAKTGSVNEYNIAEKFFKDIANGILEENDYTKNVDYAIVPGNHDCVLVDKEAAIRNALIDASLKNSSSIDEEIKAALLKSQDAFWEFYSKLTGRNETEKVSYRFEYPLNDDSAITFLCYNTSLMSRRNEIVGGLMIPENNFITLSGKYNENIVVSIFHHNTGWLTPETNNKKLFEKHVFESSNIIMCGHEHERKEYVISSLESDEKIVYLESSAFQNGKASEFFVNVIDTESYELDRHILTYHDYDNPVLKAYKDYIVTSAISKHVNGLVLNKTFEERLYKLPIPINHPIVGSIKLNDCFVFPDLEPQLSNSDDYGVYVDSQDLISKKNRNEKIYVIEGASRSGKTSLLKLLYAKILNTGVYPLLLKGEKIKDTRSILDLLKNTFENQYDNDLRPYDFYNQLDKKDKVILIDDLSQSNLNNEGVKKLYNILLQHFSCIIVTVEDNADMNNLLARADSYGDIKQYRLLSLGCLKRSKLIEKWLRLGRDVETIDVKVLEHEIKELFDTVSSILGEQFLSPYPFFLLSLLQSLNDASKNYDLHQTYYAYCYKSLLISSLSSLNMETNKQKQMLSFLNAFAYHIFVKKEIKPRLSKKEFKVVFDEYSDKYVFSYKSPESCLKDLKEATIIYDDDTHLRFSSKYIYYYLAAEKLAEKVSDKEGKELVEYLCCNLHNEECANVLLFLVYHTKDIHLLDTLVVTGSLPFEKYGPISLKTDDALFNSLNGIIENVKQEVLIRDIDPKKRRNQELENAEKAERKHNKEEEKKDVIEQLKEIEQDSFRMELLTALRSIRILGQIVKNENSGIKKDKIIEVLKQTYITCFRIIGSFVTELQDKSGEIVQYIIDESNEKGRRIDTAKLRNDIGKLIGFLVYKFCLYNFSNLTHSVGTKDLDDIYDDVAVQIGTPAAKLVSFTIKSYYGKRMSISELEELYDSFSNNPVAQQILRARAVHYVYHNTVGLADKQKIGNICKLKLVDKADLNKDKR